MSFAVYMAIFLTIALIVGMVTELRNRHKKVPAEESIPDTDVFCECTSCVEARKLGRDSFTDLYITVYDASKTNKEVHIEIWDKRPGGNSPFRFLYLKEEGIQKFIDRLEYVKKQLKQ